MLGEKTTKEYWETTHSQPRKRLPSRLNVGTGDILRLLAGCVNPGMSVLEIGCAPGKHMAYLAQSRGAVVSGLDYSHPGIAFCRDLFSSLKLQGEFRCEDIFQTTFFEGSFDLVYSLGVIEHFDDPSPIVEKHLRLAKKGGKVLITVPNYTKIYGRIQRHFDPENLRIHNLETMNTSTLFRSVPKDLADHVEVFPYGRMSPWLIHLHKRWPGLLAKGTSYALNVAGLVQPFRIEALCSMLVLSMRRRPAP